MNIKELAEQANGRFEQAWPGGVIWYWDELAEFAELVAAHTLMNIDPSKFIGGYQEGFEAGVAKEREECAKLCDEMYDDSVDGYPNWQYGVAIRARGKA